PPHGFSGGGAPPPPPDVRRPLRDLPPDELIGAVADIGGTPADVLRDKDLMATLLPLLRADFSVNETYEYRGEAPLGVGRGGGCRCGGGSPRPPPPDPRADRAELLAWEDLTTERFQLRVFPGGHFFIHDQAKELLTMMALPLAD
ncbi:thioesterase II family protein, partial [Streptomyces hygroscopicus]|uniref:thioesterase II family protein n=1 Tax=Streptomyces hygroscopicus TaxID=1912 RepID=UPI003694E991